MLIKKKTKIIILTLLCLLFLISPLSSAISIKITSTQYYKKLIKNQNFNNDLIPEMLVNVSEYKLKEYIQMIQDFGPHPTSSTPLDNVGKYLYKELSTMDIMISYDYWELNRKSGKNIVATLPGESDAIVIVCAHYDSISISPGADDDGSGIAIVLMLAEIMRYYSFNATVKFILFSGEEQGLLGSKEYARKAYENNKNIIGVLAIDKVGYAKTEEDGKKIRHHSNDESEWMVNISEEISRIYSDQIDLEVIKLPSDPSSDHYAFTNYGFDGSNLVEETLNPTYHTSEDTIEHINMSYLTKVCKLTLGIITKIANINTIITDDDIEITIKGSCLAEDSQFIIKVENNKHSEDTANVIIKIEMKHIFRKKYVSTIKEYYTNPCSWYFTKRIDEYWEFKINNRRYTRGLFKLEVTIHGLDDDINLYKQEQTYGMIIRPYKILLIPRI